MQDENLYSPPSSYNEPSTNERKHEEVTLTEFDLTRIFKIGFEGMNSNTLKAAGFQIAWFALYAIVINSCIGWVVVPHLLAGYSIAGIALARKEFQIESMFKGFNPFGSVFAMGVILLGLQIAYIVLIFTFTFFAFYKIGDLFSPSDFMNIPPKNITSIVTVILMIPLIVAVQLFFSARLLAVFPLIVEKGMTPLEALNASWKRSSPFTMKLIFLHLVSDVILPIIGLMLCGAGILITMPFAASIKGAATIYLLDGDLKDEAKPLPKIEQQSSKSNAPNPYDS